MSELPDLQDAVRALQGVAHASVRWPEPEGPATLYVVFSEHSDREATIRGVLEALRAVGRVDLSTLRVDAAAPAASPPSPNGTRRTAARRAVFSGLSVERSDLATAVTVTLRLGGRTLVGRAEGLATRRVSPRTAAAAALLALQDVLPADLRLQLESLEVVDGHAPHRPAVVHSAVACLAAGGEQTYVGSAIVREDLREAAVRATLDALNRRLERDVAQ